MTGRTLLVLASLALAACGTTEAPEEDAAGTPAVSTGTPAERPDATDATEGGTPTPVGSEASAAFLAAVEESLVGTDYAGLALADPEGFVATGEVMCDLLGDGATVDEVLSAYLVELDEARGGVEDDDAILSGAVLGAATGSICPQHAGLLEE